MKIRHKSPLSIILQWSIICKLFRFFFFLWKCRFLILVWATFSVYEQKTTITQCDVNERWMIKIIFNVMMYTRPRSVCCCPPIEPVGISAGKMLFFLISIPRIYFQIFNIRLSTMETLPNRPHIYLRISPFISFTLLPPGLLGKNTNPRWKSKKKYI